MKNSVQHGELKYVTEYFGSFFLVNVVLAVGSREIETMLMNNFLELFSADTNEEVLKQLYLPLAFVWRYRMFLLADSC